MTDQLTGALIFAAVIVVFAALVFMRQMPLQILARMFRPIARIAGRGGAKHAGAKTARAAQDPLNPTAWAAVAPAFRDRTRTEEALGDDFDHEESHIARHGGLFEWIQHRVGYIRVPEELADELAATYAQRCEEFLASPVPIHSYVSTFYEDVEGAVIAEYFHASDRGSLYLLNEYRKIINGNLRKLLIWFSISIGLYLVAVLFPGASAWFDVVGWTGLSTPAWLAPEAINLGAWALMVSLALILFASAVYGFRYIHFQRNNTREMSNFITRYMARLNNHYRTSVGKANAVTVGSERDARELADEARRWHLANLWMGLRVFFIESYVRNVRYQIGRNTSMYYAFVPTAFALVYGFALWIVWGNGLAAPPAAAALPGAIFGLLILVAALALIGRGAMDCLSELDPDEWISFDQLGLADALGGVVGKYVEDVGYWKTRVGGI